MVHGGGRNADVVFRTALAAAFLAERLQDTVVIAPQFSGNDGENCTDDLAENELNFPCAQPVSWRVGSAAKNDTDVTSFDVVDQILRNLAANEAFPNLSSIVVAGHSAGGTFVTHYEMTNLVHESLDVPVTYVAANAGQYAYLDSLRPSRTAYPTNVAATTPQYVPPSGGTELPPFIAFSDAESCIGYDNWPYGLQNRFGYSARVSDEQLKKQLADRPTTYLVGWFDTRRGGGSCSGTSQGPSRLARGLAYARHVNERHSAEHEILVVPACGHNHRCMFSMDPVLPFLFPEK
jgi:pimeloyl-ACP methyl ester carboxylesterase